MMCIYRCAKSGEQKKWKNFISCSTSEEAICRPGRMAASPGLSLYSIFAIARWATPPYCLTWRGDMPTPINGTASSESPISNFSHIRHWLRQHRQPLWNFYFLINSGKCWKKWKKFHQRLAKPIFRVVSLHRFRMARKSNTLPTEVQQKPLARASPINYIY